jgi:hypothetical protein
MVRMNDADRLPLLVLLPGLDGTGKLFVNFIRALGAAIESRVIGYPPLRTQISGVARVA